MTSLSENWKVGTGDPGGIWTQGCSVAPEPLQKPLHAAPSNYLFSMEILRDAGGELGCGAERRTRFHMWDT